ncbi:hypothetical protein QQ045_005628 [Rhodiola kirilowii]
MAASYFSGFGEILTKLSSSMAGLMFVFAMFGQYMPECIFKQLDSLAQKIMDYFDTNIQIIFPEFTAEGKYKRSELYSAIELYLSSVASAHAKRLKADMSKKSKNPVLRMDDKEEVKDEFLGVQVKWISNKKESKGTSISLYENNKPDETRFYKLVFPRSHRDTFTTSYIQHLMEKAKQISGKNRQRKLYTNTGEEWCPWRSSNTQLREVLIETSSKSVLVIEDIDCSLDLSGRRKKKKNEGKKKKKGEEDEDEDEESSKSSQDNADSCLRNLIEALRLAKDEADAKAGQEEADDEAELKKLKVIGRMKQKLLKKFKKVNDVGD